MNTEKIGFVAIPMDGVGSKDRCAPGGGKLSPKRTRDLAGKRREDCLENI
jgi:hypothetical protein